MDFFSTAKDFNINLFKKKLLDTNHWQTTYEASGTLYGKYQNAKVSFIAYPFFKPSVRQYCENIRILIPEDVAVMKIIAISQCGKKRDFIDLFWYLHHKEDALDQIFLRVVKQYPQEHNIPHILRSLVYFADAEADPMPEIFFDATWLQVKKYFQKEIPIVTKRVLKLDR